MPCSIYVLHIGRNIFELLSELSNILQHLIPISLMPAGANAIDLTLNWTQGLTIASCNVVEYR